jgi:methyl-accepting chemotaxis protein
MSANNLPTNLPSVERLIQRVSAAEKAQQKNITISIQEVRELTSELAIMTSKLGRTVQEIHQMLAEIRESTTQIDVKFDGGGFNSA